MNIEGLEDNLTHLVDIKRRTGGHLFRIKPFDRITQVVVQSDDTIVVQVITHQVQERKFDTILTARGLRLVPLTRNTFGHWSAGQPITVWETDFQPVRVAAFTPSTVAQYWEKRIHEFMCHRPGTPSAPMENASFEDCTTPKMARHWRI